MRKPLITATLLATTTLGIGGILATPTHAASYTPTQAAIVPTSTDGSTSATMEILPTTLASSASSTVQEVLGTVIAMDGGTVTVKSDADGSLWTASTTSSTQYSLIYDATAETTSSVTVGSHVLVDLALSADGTTLVASRVTIWPS